MPVKDRGYGCLSSLRTLWRTSILKHESEAFDEAASSLNESRRVVGSSVGAHTSEFLNVTMGVTGRICGSRQWVLVAIGEAC